MPEVTVTAVETKKWHDGWKTFSGLAIVLIPVVSSFAGYDVSEAFPVEFALFGEEFIITAGVVLAFYGRWKAKGSMWFSKK